MATAWNQVQGALERHFAAPRLSPELAAAIDLAEESIVGEELQARAQEIESLDRRIRRMTWDGKPVSREARQ